MLPQVFAAHWARRRCWAFQVLLFVSARANKLTRRRSQIALRHSLAGEQMRSNRNYIRRVAAPGCVWQFANTICTLM
jgi:hypothetical protein